MFLTFEGEIFSQDIEQIDGLGLSKTGLNE
jgi:hypothetical protein